MDTDMNVFLVVYGVAHSIRIAFVRQLRAKSSITLDWVASEFGLLVEHLLEIALAGLGIAGMGLGLYSRVAGWVVAIDFCLDF